MPRYPRLVLVLAALLLCSAVGRPQATRNLSAQGWYADPEIRIFQGQYWIYPTSSDPKPDPAEPQIRFNPLQQKLRAKPGLRPVYLLHTTMDAFSSPDLVHWTRHPDAFDVRNSPWAAYALWAPSVLNANGKYYFFFSANDIQKNETTPGGIGVAVSDSPGGPFKDLLGHPLIARFQNGGQPIDPFVYRDDDGSIYLYFGGQDHCNVARLGPQLRRVIPMQDGKLFKDITPPNYVEGPFLIKRNGVYYLMWSEGYWGDSSYGVAYAKGSSPLGPFQPMGKILQTDPKIATGPGHHSVLHIPGTDDWYIVYHRHPLGANGANQRRMAIDRLTFNAQGNIEPIRMTADGPGPQPLPKGVEEREGPH